MTDPQPLPLSAHLVRDARRRLDLSCRDFGLAVQASARVVRGWEAGKPVPFLVQVLSVIWRTGKMPPRLTPTKASPNIVDAFDRAHTKRSTELNRMVMDGVEAGKCSSDGRV